MLPTLTAGQKCPTCGRTVEAPLHACHTIRDNYPVTEPAAPELELKPEPSSGRPTITVDDGVDAAWMRDELRVAARRHQRRADDSQAKADRGGYGRARTRSENVASDHRTKAAACEKYADRFEQARKTYAQQLVDALELETPPFNKPAGP